MSHGRHRQGVTAPITVPLDGSDLARSAGRRQRSPTATRTPTGEGGGPARRRGIRDRDAPQFVAVRLPRDGQPPRRSPPQRAPTRGLQVAPESSSRSRPPVRRDRGPAWSPAPRREAPRDRPAETAWLASTKVPRWCGCRGRRRGHRTCGRRAAAPAEHEDSPERDAPNAPSPAPEPDLRRAAGREARAWPWCRPPRRPRDCRRPRDDPATPTVNVGWLGSCDSRAGHRNRPGPARCRNTRPAIAHRWSPLRGYHWPPMSLAPNDFTQLHMSIGGSLRTRA